MMTPTQADELFWLEWDRISIDEPAATITGRPRTRRSARRSPSSRRRPARHCTEGDDGPGEPASDVHAYRILDGLNVPQDYDEGYMCEVALRLLRQASIEMQETGSIARPHDVAWGIHRWIVRDLVPHQRAKLTRAGMRFPCRCESLLDSRLTITRWGVTLYCETCWNAGVRSVPDTGVTA